ncbi:hypothetical protein EW145_g4433 [Phellinidium pouzarii]|uniref:Impact N-terminal domain-containing protein n=1 Tax=Phellinidium pouzarii TaxID=167371 RepID=A0A4S4L414_9AGAM|nr:hypothetical protein EW145_g4433 [Phellinidium pouzarii]
MDPAAGGHDLQFNILKSSLKESRAENATFTAVVMSLAAPNLDSFLTFSSPPPTALATANEIQDRDSTFTGAIYRATSPTVARRALRHHAQVVHSTRPASHEIAAWRCMVLRAGRDGLRGPEDFEVVSGSEDDGEQNGGRTVLRTMEKEGVIDAIVVVSRWFGGTLLGPVRFTHIETCTREVCRTFRAIEDVEAVIEELKELDVRLAQLRAELVELTVQPQTDSSTSYGAPLEPEGQSSLQSPIGVPAINRAIDYTAMLLSPIPDLPRAKRLLVARQNAIRSVNDIIARNRSRS